MFCINSSVNRFSNEQTMQRAGIHKKHKREEQTGHLPLLFQAQVHWHMMWTWNDCWESSDRCHSNTHTMKWTHIHTANSYCTSPDSLLGSCSWTSASHSQKICRSRLITWIVSVAQQHALTTRNKSPAWSGFNTTGVLILSVSKLILHVLRFNFLDTEKFDGVLYNLRLL